MTLFTCKINEKKKTFFYFGVLNKLSIDTRVRVSRIVAKHLFFCLFKYYNKFQPSVTCTVL